jgi:small-conductance mechanosensitive channel
MDKIILGNSVRIYLEGFGIFFGMVLTFYIFTKIIGRITKKTSEKISNPILRKALIFDRKLNPILQVAPFYFLVNYFELPQRVDSFVTGVWVIVITFCVIRYISELFRVVLSEYVKSAADLRPTVVHGLGMVATGLLYVFGLLFVLSNLGFNITTLITGLGIGGMAVALASQTLLSDLFNYFTILIDKPFEIGDQIIVNGVQGYVKSIGLKGTRILSINGEWVVISNTDMTKSILRNYQPMVSRRIIAKLGIVYDTPAEKVKAIPAMLKEIVESTRCVDFGRAHFAEFGDFSLNFELVYNVQSNDYATYMDLQHEINVKIMERFQSEGIVFAYPTQSLYVSKV